jgi:hypothetical protein
MTLAIFIPLKLISARPQANHNINYRLFEAFCKVIGEFIGSILSEVLKIPIPILSYK